MNRPAPVAPKRFSLHLLAISTALSLVGQHAQAGVWAGATGTWSGNGNPGWNGTGVPDAAGATATFSTAGTTTQDIAAGVTIGSLLLSGNVVRTITNTPVSGNGGITFDNSGSSALIQNSGGAASALIFGGTALGGINLTSNGLRIENTGSSAVANGAIQFGGSGGAIHGTGNLTLSNATNNAPVSDTNVNPIDGSIYLSSTSDFTGSVLIEKGAVSFSSAAGIATAFGGTANTITLGSANNNATLMNANTTNVNTLANNIIVASTANGETRLLGANSSGSLNNTYSGALTLNGDVTLYSNRNGSASSAVSYTGVISGVGGVTITGAGQTRFTNANTFTGGVTINSGALLLVNAGALNSTAGSQNAVTFGAGSTGVLQLTGNSVTVSNLSSNASVGTPIVRNNNPSAGAVGAATLTVGNSANLSGTFAGVIQNGATSSGTPGALSLIKAGTGTLTLSGSNTYTGTTAINAGTLLINGNQSAATGAVTVNSTGILGGSGTIGGAVTAAAGSFLAPGTNGTAGNLTLASSLNVSGLAGGAAGHLFFDLGSSVERITLSTGVLTIGSGVLEFDDFNFSAITGFGAGTYTLFDTAQTISGTLGSSLTGTVGGLSATLSFANSNTDIILTVVPEPNVAVLLVLGSIGSTVLLARRRRRLSAR